jgi:DNA polymerase (family 10)
MDPAGLAAVLREIATYLDLERDRYRARAYRRAAESLEATPDVPRLLAEERLTELPGVGDKLARTIAELAATGTTASLHELRLRHLIGKDMRLHIARDLGEGLAAHVRGGPAAREVVVCGAVRRWIEVVDRIVLAVATTDPAAVRERLRGHPLGAHCELHTAPPERFGAALIAATGSDAHVAALRARGLDLDTAAGADEAAVYRTVGLPPIPPEVRDGSDELSGDDFTDLIRLEDIQGAVHCHTVYSDGKHTIEEMAGAAQSRRLSYLTITDHSVSAGYAGGLSADELRAQGEEIEAVQRRVGIRILRGTESDIRRDGELDYPDDVLGGLDVVIASIHQRYKLDPEAMTRRVVTAMRSPVFKIWGHGLGRMILSRPPIEVDFEAILDAICASPAAIEINGDPHRLDLDPERARRAHRRGIKFVLSTDAHSMKQLDYLENAVGMARRARLRRRDVLNALPLDEFVRAVRPAPSGRGRS